MASKWTDPGPGGEVGSYTIIRRLAVGGMAELFLARPSTTDGAESTARVVLKIPLPKVAGDEEFIRHFTHEATLNAALHHPNLVEVSESGLIAGRPYLVMEYIDGVALDVVLATRRATGKEPRVDVAFLVVTKLLEALAHVHTATDEANTPLNIVHRDVNPQNILVSRSGRVCLGDFGIARSALGDAKTRTGVIKGKVGYLSPEQVTGSDIDCRTDLYSAGLVFWEMLTGEPFLQGNSELELLRKAEEPIFRSPSTARHDLRLPRALDGVLRLALGRFPEERFQSAEEFLAAIQKLEIDWTGDQARKSLAELVRESLDRSDAMEPETNAEDSIRSDVARSRGEKSATRHIDAPGGGVRRRAPSIAIAAVMVIVGIIGAVVVMSTDETPEPPPLSAHPATKGTTTKAPVSSPQDSPSANRADGDAEISTDEVIATATTGSRSTPQRQKVRPLTSKHRAAVEKPPPVTLEAPDGESGERADAEPAMTELRRRTVALKRQLGQRGILVGDLTTEQRSQLASVENAKTLEQIERAEGTLSELEGALRNQHVDAAFVRRKLDRVGAMIKSAQRRGVDTSQLEELQSLALQEHLDGRYEETNLHLGQIIHRLSGSVRLRDEADDGGSEP